MTRTPCFVRNIRDGIGQTSPCLRLQARENRVQCANNNDDPSHEDAKGNADPWSYTRGNCTHTRRGMAKIPKDGAFFR